MSNTPTERARDVPVIQLKCKRFILENTEGSGRIITLVEPAADVDAAILAWDKRPALHQLEIQADREVIQFTGVRRGKVRINYRNAILVDFDLQ